MSAPEKEECALLSHHEQQELCTTRLPYRQGRKLTAVKVYTVNNESKHLLIFGVPSLNLRRETKELFMKFGKLIQFNLTTHPSEEFTETYHALYESVQSARLAKRMLDTKNYYGGNLHICYAPEFESIDETKEKLMLRKTHVLGRLKTLQREKDLSKDNPVNVDNEIINTRDLKQDSAKKMYMGEINTIKYGKRKIENAKFDYKKIKNKKIEIVNVDSSKTERGLRVNIDVSGSSKTNDNNKIEIIDFTSAQTKVISNIHEALNYKSFGQEIIKKIPYKPVNRIKFNINKNCESFYFFNQLQKGGSQFIAIFF